MAKVVREELLRRLQSVRAGLSAKPTSEQSDCFVFSGGKVHTFDNEVAVRAPSLLNGVEGAVRAKEFLEMLSKMTEEEIVVKARDKQLIISGQGSRRWGMALEAEVGLPLDSLKEPEEAAWRPLHPDFLEAVATVGECVLDKGDFGLSCLHVHPDWVEGCDGTQLCRWPLKTGVSAAFLAAKRPLKEVAALGLSEFAETETWVHFRNADGLALSCLRNADVADYPSDQFTKTLARAGTPTALPKGLAEAARRAEVFTKLAADNKVWVSLAGGKARLRGECSVAWYEESRKSDYAGPELKFCIAPAVLQEVVTKHAEVQVAADFLKVEAGKYTYLTVLGA